MLRGISWARYEEILHELGNAHYRVAYDNGVLEMMAPVFEHEDSKTSLARLIEMMCFEREIDVKPLGSLTCRRQDLLKGIEPDECYYVEHAADIAGKKTLDFQIDPPPDLAIEVDVTSSSLPRQPIFAALGVPELWRFDGRLAVLRLQPNGRYESASSSGVFPFLPIKTFESYFIRMGNQSQLQVLKEFQKWVRTL